MAISPRHRRIIDRYLSPRASDDYDSPTWTLTLSKRQMAFLIEAIDHFESSRCPIESKGVGCELLSWFESPSTGAVEITCPVSCSAWKDELIEMVVPGGAGQAMPQTATADRLVPAD